MHDIVIIGAGPAGMTAALYALRAWKSVLVLEAESFGGQSANSPVIENYPGIKSISGNEFADILLGQIMDLGAEIDVDCVAGIKPHDGIFSVYTKNAEHRCRAVIIASGVRHRRLGIPSEEKYIGSGISFCAVCDGAFYKGKTVAVVGGGSTALQDAALCALSCEKVYLIHRRDTLRGEKYLTEALKKKPNVVFLLDTVITGFVGKGKLSGLCLANTKSGEEFELQVDGLFEAVGHVPRNEIFADTVSLDGSGYILAGEDCVTSCPGIFAAGDCRTKEVRQITTAAADGAVAALAAISFIMRAG